MINYSLRTYKCNFSYFHLFSIVICYKISQTFIMQYDVTRIICMSNDVEYLNKELSYNSLSKVVIL